MDIGAPSEVEFQWGVEMKTQSTRLLAVLQIHQRNPLHETLLNAVLLQSPSRLYKALQQRKQMRLARERKL
jgi:hypothetical protein